MLSQYIVAGYSTVVDCCNTAVAVAAVVVDIAVVGRNIVVAAVVVDHSTAVVAVVDRSIVALVAMCLLVHSHIVGKWHSMYHHLQYKQLLFHW